MPAGYLPQTLSDFRTWIINFSVLLTANPGLYGLAAADAATVATTEAAFVAAYAISTAPTTRSPTTIQTTITARNTAVQIVRGYARIILANAGVADADKLALGLHLRNPVNTPVPAPLTNPLLSLIGAQPGQITATYKDSAAAGKIKAKPVGAVALELRVFFGNAIPASPSATPFYGMVTKSPFPINCPNGSAGQTAYCYGRWVTRKGLQGPWGPLASMVCV